MNADRYGSIREVVEVVRGVWPVELLPSKITRFDDRDGRRGNRACWGYLTPDEQVAVTGNWRDSGLRAHYVKGGDARKLSRAEQRALDAQIREARRKAEEQREAEWFKAAAIAAEIVRSSRSADGLGHPYLSRKRVRPVAPLGVLEAGAVRSIYEQATGERASWLWSYKRSAPMSGPLLVVPCYLGGFTDRLSSVELIDAAGSKVCLRGGRMSGAFWTPVGLGAAVQAGKRIGIAEGIATALSLTQVKGLPCVAARSCVNLEATAIALRNRFPRAELVVCGDRGNGEEAATVAAEKARALIAVPFFSKQLLEQFKRITGGDKPTDFNDYYVATGDL